MVFKYLTLKHLFQVILIIKVENITKNFKQSSFKRGEFCRKASITCFCSLPYYDCRRFPRDFKEKGQKVPMKWVLYSPGHMTELCEEQFQIKSITHWKFYTELPSKKML